MKSFQIRDLQKEDISTIIKIMFEFPATYPEDYVNSNKRGSIRWLLNYLLHPEDIYDGGSFVLEVDNKIVGHAAYLKDTRCFEGGVYELRALVVDKKYQNRGYSEKLIKHLESELKKISGRSVWLQTGRKDITSYYKSMGYKSIGKYPNYWGPAKHRYILSKVL
jgi:GNAT superfamily N-acetyltransferase